jgi:hypothetical protein
MRLSGIAVWGSSFSPTPQSGVPRTRTPRSSSSLEALTKRRPISEAGTAARWNAHPECRLCPGPCTLRTTPDRAFDPDGDDGADNDHMPSTEFLRRVR